MTKALNEKQIRCACGEVVELKEPLLVVGKNGKVELVFTCKLCGQRFITEAPKDIILDD